MARSTVKIYCADVEAYQPETEEYWEEEVYYRSLSHCDAIVSGVRWAEKVQKDTGSKYIKLFNVHYVKLFGIITDTGQMNNEYIQLFSWQRNIDLPLNELIPDKLSALVNAAIQREPELEAVSTV